METLVHIDQITAATGRVADLARVTPVIESHALSGVAGRPVFLKAEHLQRTGSFKIRGAYNHLRVLRSTGYTGRVVAASAGNHAQGVALGASKCGLESVIFMPGDAALPKVEATRAYGAEVRSVPGVVDEALAAAYRHAQETGDRLVPPFADLEVIAGQGTIGLEIAQQVPHAEAVIVPVGGGGLISGIAAALASTPDPPLVIGVQAEGAASMVESLREGRPVSLDQVTTIADGIALRDAHALPLAHVQRFVDRVVTVPDDAIARALLLLLERTKAVVEPAAAVGMAALQAGLVPGDGPAVVVLSGGNVDPQLLTRLIEFGLAAAGRYLRLEVELPDRPGALADLSRSVADLGLNVLEIVHHRTGVDVALGAARVDLLLETRNAAHAAESVRALSDAGFRVERA